MSDDSMNMSQLLKQALHTIQKLKMKEHNVQNEPIAIIGMACRFPGGCTSPEKFWELINKGGDAVTQIPESRFDINEFYDPDPEQQGKIYIREGGFLNEDISLFDAGFFGISPREALEMDPQQRMLLELAWEALERACINPQTLKNSRTGVFIGQIGSEYGFFDRTADEAISPYTVTGMLPNLSSGRLAYFFGFQGPAITLDTACSSSLVSIHLACASLRRRECNLALAGGVSLMISPEIFIMLCKVNALAKDGRCKTFDANADGYGRGEGGGLIVLKRLKDALHDGDNILAVIKGSAINQDGPSSGLTVPNGLAQQAVIQEALKNSGISSNDVGYFETHGTGTLLGDPVEIQAINAIYGGSSRQTPLYLGSVKSNIGHLEAAAGVAALIKTVLCIQHATIPANIHLKTINPRLDLESIPSVIPTTPVTWTSHDQTKIAAISSFGFSGTNAHFIVAEPPRHSLNQLKNTQSFWQVFTMSARNDSVLHELALRYQQFFSGSDSSVSFENICYSVNRGRAIFPNRLAIVAKDRAHFCELLNGYLQGNPDTEYVVQSKESERQLKTVFLFQSDRSELNYERFKHYFSYSVFNTVLDECSALLNTLTGQDWFQKLHNQPISISAPHVFAIHYAMAKLWMDWGILPNAVMGDHTGILVAATLAGVMSLKDALSCAFYGSITENVSLNTPQIQILRADNGEFVKKSQALDKVFWREQCIQPVDLHRGLDTLYKDGYSLIVVAGDKDINELQKFIALYEEDNEQELVKKLAILYCLGISLNWEGYYGSMKHSKVVLPVYPFQRKSYWIGRSNKQEIKSVHSSINPLEGRQINSPLPEKLCEFVFSLKSIPELKDTHNMVHVGYYVKILSNTMKHYFGTGVYKILFLEFLSVMMIAPEQIKSVFLVLRPKPENLWEVEISSREHDAMSWNIHVRGMISFNIESEFDQFNLDSLDVIKNRCLKQFTRLSFYEGMQRRGIELGKSVQCMEEAFANETEALVRFQPLTNPDVPVGVWDSCLQLFNAVLTTNNLEKSMFMLARMKDYSILNIPEKGDVLWCHFMINNIKSEGNISGSFTLFTQSGIIISTCDNFEMNLIDPKFLHSLVHSSTGSVNSVSTALRQEMEQKSASEQVDLMQNYLLKLISSHLNLTPEELDSHIALNTYGMDSLVGMEIRTALSRELGIDCPMDVLLSGTTLENLTLILTQKLADHNRETPSSPPNKQENLWLVKNDLFSSASMLLYCFPYGGGSASLYRDWQGLMPQDIAVIPVQLPGRENRFNEKPITDINEMIENLVDVISPELNRPYAFYGHSAGGLIAYRLAKKMLELGEPGRLMKKLFIAAYTAPSNSPNPWYAQSMARLNTLGFDSVPDLNHLQSCSDDLLELIIKSLGLRLDISTYKNSKNEMDYIRLLISKLLGDLKLVGSYIHSSQEMQLDVPITAFHGENDDRVTYEELNLWSTFTLREFKSYCLPGDHFFLDKSQSMNKLIRIICSELGVK